LLAIHAFLSARVIGELKLSHIAAGPTELRLLLIGLTISMYAFGDVGPRIISLEPFDLIIGLVGSLLIILFAIQTLITARRLERMGE
jgi:hypothetical protein